ncbi:hypothetical protein H920_02988 [Fukomys damarensis]|uniref:Uncharacterized protein n=1 Tax=Fukomys damarensis TaxID=885580 RepID=A0A091EJC0_FUKDA|nr:hypothetical protein H920_02988 [Fukomys damarensis]
MPAAAGLLLLLLLLLPLGTLAAAQGHGALQRRQPQAHQQRGKSRHRLCWHPLGAAVLGVPFFGVSWGSAWGEGERRKFRVNCLGALTSAKGHQLCALFIPFRELCSPAS